jgi:hypothetical protein
MSTDQPVWKRLDLNDPDTWRLILARQREETNNALWEMAQWLQTECGVTSDDRLMPMLRKVERQLACAHVAELKRIAEMAGVPFRNESGIGPA